MKKLVFFVVFTVILAAGSPVFAQQTDRKKHDSEYYYKNVTLERIYPYRNGYLIQYRRGLNRIEKGYIPMEWFTDSAGRGEIITLPKGKAWPSLSVYYKNGEFSHVRLYVHHLASHETWGTIPQNVNMDSQFEGIERFDFKF
ncbi:MAG: hypothetical protein FWF55_07150 [Treponema sp.]|nr:hypothetical protein [Treponema sp.]